jgi:hypothetical protein
MRIGVEPDVVCEKSPFRSACVGSTMPGELRVEML